MKMPLSTVGLLVLTLSASRSFAAGTAGRLPIDQLSYEQGVQFAERFVQVVTDVNYGTLKRTLTALSQLSAVPVYELFRERMSQPPQSNRFVQEKFKSRLVQIDRTYEARVGNGRHYMVDAVIEVSREGGIDQRRRRFWLSVVNTQAGLRVTDFDVSSP